MFDKTINEVDSVLDHFSKHFLNVLILSHIIYIVVYVGIFSINQKYVNDLNWIGQLAICIFLILRFHPFRKHTLKENDANIILACASFLLLNLGVIQIVDPYLKKNISFIQKS
jgi:hypothetical protein